MSLISYTNIVDGTSIDASDVNNPFNTIYNDYNGGISSANLTSNAITTAKITDANVTPAKWTNPYKFSAYRNAAQNVGTGATKVGWDTENYDSNNNFDITGGFSRYTAPVSGFYHFDAVVTATTAGTAIGIYADLYKNGSLIRKGNKMPSIGSGTDPAVTVSGDLQLTAGDYVEVYSGTVTAAKALDVSNVANNVFSGHLISVT